MNECKKTKRSDIHFFVTYRRQLEILTLVVQYWGIRPTMLTQYYYRKH